MSLQEVSGMSLQEVRVSVSRSGMSERHVLPDACGGAACAVELRSKDIACGKIQKAACPLTDAHVSGWVSEEVSE